MLTIDVTLSLGLNNLAPGTSLTIFKDKIVALNESPRMGTILICSGGVSLPVKEDKQTILSKMKEE